MTCADCNGDVLAFTVPGEYEEFLRGSESTVGLCTRCLTLQPVPGPTGEPAFERVSDTFPTEPEAAIPMALLLGLLGNLALYRSEIATLLEAVERAGVDPLLVLDRLARDDGIETDLDLAGRRRQLQQLL